jgi:hypothetical protein
MNLLPVISREMRLIARQPRTYWMRSAVGLVVALSITGIIFAGFAGMMAPGVAGRQVFLALSGIGYVLVLCSGALNTADCLSEEKREGTLGLLLLTSLRAGDVIAAKLISRGGTTAYFLLACVPPLGLTLFVGGVTGLDFMRMAAALLCGLIFAMSLGMLISALSFRERPAMLAAVLCVMGSGLGLPLVGYAVMQAAGKSEIHPVFVLLNPSGAVLLAATFPSVPGNFLSALGMPLLISGICLVLAGGILPGITRENPAGTGPAAGKRRQVKDARLRRKAAALMEINPILGLRARCRRAWRVPLFFLLLGSLWVAGWSSFGPVWLSVPALLCAMFVLELALLFLAAFEASRPAVEERRSGVMELLLTTPLGEEGVLKGNLWALKRHLSGPLAVVLLLHASLIAVAWNGISIAERFALCISAALLLLKLFADLYLVSWMGVWRGLTSRSAARALSETLVNAVLFPWLVFLCSVGVIALASQGRALASPEQWVLGGLWLALLMAASYLTHLGAAMNELRDDLRGLVAGEEISLRHSFRWTGTRRTAGREPGWRKRAPVSQS